jgi:hypothetical protein
LAKQVPLLTYAEVRGRIGTERSHLLLGNGFSIACDTIFGYENLLKFAKANGLTKRILGVFEHLGTNDFERVMRLLDDADWITQHYRLRKPSEGSAGPFAADLAIVKTALIEAITRTHLAHPNLIPESRKKCCAKFLKPYHNVFTTNYDALLYWVEMSDPELLGQDGFRADEDAESGVLGFDLQDRYERDELRQLLETAIADPDNGLDEHDRRAMRDECERLSDYYGEDDEGTR